MAEQTGIKIISQNKKAFHDYFVDEEFEAGIELCGTEVKSVRQGKVNLKDSYVSLKTGEAILIGMHISPYENGNIYNKEPLRSRRLLLHRKEINKLIGKVQLDGYTIIPLKVYLKNSLVKVSVGLCRGKKNYDKRDAEAKKTAKRNIERAIREQSKI